MTAKFLAVAMFITLHTKTLFYALQVGMLIKQFRTKIHQALSSLLLIIATRQKAKDTIAELCHFVLHKCLKLP
jgi:hypothetical protein